MQRSRLAIVVSVVITACARQMPVPNDGPMPATADDDDDDDDGDEQTDAPALCSAAPEPLDDAGRAMLRALEQHIIADIVGPAHERHRLFNIADIHSLIRRYPDAELLFVFPLQVPAPETGFRVRFAATRDGLSDAAHMIFYVDLSDVEQLSSGGERALLVYYAGGPTGAPPPNASWLWGLWARYCVIRHPTGDWSAYPIGAVIMSQRHERGP